jgi:AGCS family alanine or glycine:cation symporter
MNIDETIDSIVRPFSEALSKFIFFEVEVFGAAIPLIVVWLMGSAVFFTFYFRFINVTGFIHAVHLVRGKYSSDDHEGEVSHFQALATALAGTVGIGNIGGVAVVISLGGPGATFWLIMAGLFGMSTKFIECIAGVMYRRVNEEGVVSGGPMYYLERGLADTRLRVLAKPLGLFYGFAMVLGCLGIGNMFQSNQAFQQFLVITGGESSQFADKGWLFGIVLAVGLAAVIIGGLKGIARVTSKLVPLMAAIYVVLATAIIIMNFDKVPWAIGAIISEAFSPKAVAGGTIGVMVLGFKRAVFSNEAGIGSAAIAHSAVRTNEPVTEGFVGLLEPFIDTVVICTMTALVILTTVYDPSLAGAEIQGVELTSRAFESTISWSVLPLSIVAILFAFSTTISWSYYGLKGWTYVFGHSTISENVFKSIFCLFVVLGCSIQLDAVLDFSDAMVFVVALPNVIGLFVLAPRIKRELKKYQSKIKAG